MGVCACEITYMVVFQCCILGYFKFCKFEFSSVDMVLIVLDCFKFGKF